MSTQSESSLTNPYLVINFLPPLLTSYPLGYIECTIPLQSNVITLLGIFYFSSFSIFINATVLKAHVTSPLQPSVSFTGSIQSLKTFILALAIILDQNKSKSSLFSLKVGTVTDLPVLSVVSTQILAQLDYSLLTILSGLQSFTKKYNVKLIFPTLLYPIHISCSTKLRIILLWVYLSHFSSLHFFNHSD